MVAQAVAKKHGTALTNLLQNGAKVPLAMRTDARAVLNLAEETELTKVKDIKATWVAKADEAKAKAEATAQVLAAKRAEMSDCTALEIAAARSATSAQLAAPAIKESSTDVVNAQSTVSKLAGQLHGHREDVGQLKAQIARLQQQLQDTEEMVQRLTTEYEVSSNCVSHIEHLHHLSSISLFRALFVRQSAGETLKTAQARVVEVEGKNDTAKREMEKHEAAVALREAANEQVEQAIAEDAAAQNVLRAADSGLRDAKAVEGEAMATARKVQECAERLAVSPGAAGCLEAKEAVNILLAMPASFRVQRMGLDLLVALAREPEHAHEINAHNGQQAILFNVFRELLSDDIEILRGLLAASRLQNIDTVSKAISAAAEIKSAPALVAALCEPALATESGVQLRGVRAILDLFENHDTALYQLQSEVDVRRQLSGLLVRLQEECPMELDLCAAAARLAALLAVFERINDAMELRLIGTALQSVEGGAPLAFRCFAAKKCLHDVGLISSAPSAAVLSDMLRLLPLSLADTAVSAGMPPLLHARASILQHAHASSSYVFVFIVQKGGPVKRVHGILEIAEWLSQTDEDSGGDGYLAAHLENLLGHEVSSLATAKEAIEDYGDLREWQIPKDAAKALFSSLQVRLLERL